ncbi:MAG: M24 family metallopeptidase [Solobacterium sp.]|nr:M24 family metallopeptidase [Solobacterium sp.]
MYDINEQHRIQDEMLEERLEKVLPAVMEETGTPFWIIASREYNEDPVFHHIVPALYPTARRLTILVFAEYGKERISVSMPDAVLNRYYRHDWDREKETQMDALVRIIRQYDPETINIDISDHYAYTDGLSSGLYRKFLQELPEDITARFRGNDQAGIRLMETRTETELKYYPEVMDTALSIIEEAFSDEVITPGKTTCRDVMDYMTKRVNELGITCWFPPDVNLQNEKGMQEEDTVIQRGDLLHCDFGITYLHLCTDTQRLCWVRREAGEELPEELQKAMRRNNAFKDIVRRNMTVGRSGNEVFTESIRQGKEASLRPVLYTHPLGLFGHACGPTIGLWNVQGPVYPSGELKVHEHTSYALELSTIEYLEMYQRDTFMFTEESVVLVDGKVDFLGEGRENIKVIG